MRPLFVGVLFLPIRCKILGEPDSTPNQMVLHPALLIASSSSLLSISARVSQPTPNLLVLKHQAAEFESFLFSKCEIIIDEVNSFCAIPVLQVLDFADDPLWAETAANVAPELSCFPKPQLKTQPREILTTSAGLTSKTLWFCRRVQAATGALQDRAFRRGFR